MKFCVSKSLGLIVLVILSFVMVRAPLVRADSTIAWQAFETVATAPIPGIAGFATGIVLDLLVDLPTAVGIPASLSIYGGGTFDAGQQVTLGISVNTGDDCGAQLNIAIIEISPDGQATTTLENVHIIDLPCDQQIGMNLLLVPEADLAVVGQIGIANSYANIFVNGGQSGGNSPPYFSGGTYLSPTTVAAGGTVTAYFSITNPNSYPVQVGLGMSIRPVGTDNEISDPNNDIVVLASSGTNTYTRTFYVPTYASAGSYEWILAIWSGSPGSSNQYANTGWNGGLNVVSY